MLKSLSRFCVALSGLSTFPYYFGILLVGACILQNVISAQWISSFII